MINFKKNIYSNSWITLSLFTCFAFGSAYAMEMTDPKKEKKEEKGFFKELNVYEKPRYSSHSAQITLVNNTNTRFITKSLGEKPQYLNPSETKVWRLKFIEVMKGLSYIEVGIGYEREKELPKKLIDLTIYRTKLQGESIPLLSAEYTNFFASTPIKTISKPIVSKGDVDVKLILEGDDLQKSSLEVSKETASSIFGNPKK